MLLRQDRVHGFRSPAKASAFGERVAAKYRRPALHDDLTGEFIARLNKVIAPAKKAGDVWPDPIEQFRLLVTAGDKLNPKNVTAPSPPAGGRFR